MNTGTVPDSKRQTSFYLPLCVSLRAPMGVSRREENSQGSRLAQECPGSLFTCTVSEVSERTFEALQGTATRAPGRTLTSRMPRDSEGTGTSSQRVARCLSTGVTSHCRSACLRHRPRHRRVKGTVPSQAPQAAGRCLAQKCCPL